MRDGRIGKSVLADLCDHPDIKVQHVAAMNMLHMNYKAEKAMETLISVAESNTLVISLVAVAQIQSWRETGSIDPPSAPINQKVSKKKRRKDTLPTFEPALAEYEELNDKQRVAFLASIYDGEVNNGGHYQYFENKGTQHIQETIDSLKTIGADKQSNILRKAYKLYLSKERKHPNTIAEFVEEESEEEFLKYDIEYYNVEPEVQDLVEIYLEENEF